MEKTSLFLLLLIGMPAELLITAGAKPDPRDEKTGRISSRFRSLPVGWFYESE